MKKEVKNDEGFNCKNQEDKKRIWKRLTDDGYPMFFKPELDYYLTIVFIDGKFCNFGEVNGVINESEFFGEVEWTPKAGEWVEVSDNRKFWAKRQYLATVNKQYICVVEEGKINGSSSFNTWLHIRQIPPIPEMTIAEAEQKFKIKIKQP